MKRRYVPKAIKLLLMANVTNNIFYKTVSYRLSIANMYLWGLYGYGNTQAPTLNSCFDVKLRCKLIPLFSWELSTSLSIFFGGKKSLCEKLIISY